MKIAIYLLAAEQQDAGVLVLRDRADRLSGKSEILDYVEDTSWHTEERPVFAQLILDARSKKIEVVVVRRLQDLGSSMNNVVNNLTTLDSSGVRILITSIGIDTGIFLFYGKLVVKLLGAFVRFEQDMIRRRIRAGVAVAQRTGRRSGRTPRDFPRDVALDLRKSGKSWRAIGRELGVPQSTVRDALARLQKAS